MHPMVSLENPHHLTFLFFFMTPINPSSSHGMIRCFESPLVVRRLAGDSLEFFCFDESVFVFG
jgi:hypothetical protein